MSFYFSSKRGFEDARWARRRIDDYFAALRRAEIAENIKEKPVELLTDFERECLEEAVRIEKAQDETDYVAYRSLIQSPATTRAALRAYFGNKLPALEARHKAEQ